MMKLSLETKKILQEYYKNVNFKLQTKKLLTNIEKR